MIRHRWLRADWPISISMLGQRLAKKAFSDDVEQGFLVDRLRPDHIVARFVERLDVLETVMDPLGRTSEYKRIDFRQIAFTVSTGPLGLEIRGSSKTYRPFINALSEICDFDLSINNILVDPVDWGNAINKMTSGAYFFESAQLSDIVIASGVTAKVVMQGRADIMHPLQDFVKEKPHKVDKIKLQTSASPKYSIILSSNGSASIAGAESVDRSNIVRSCLGFVLSSA